MHRITRSLLSLDVVWGNRQGSSGHASPLQQANAFLKHSQGFVCVYGYYSVAAAELASHPLLHITYCNRAKLLLHEHSGCYDMPRAPVRHVTQPLNAATTMRRRKREILRRYANYCIRDGGPIKFVHHGKNQLQEKKRRTVVVSRFTFHSERKALHRVYRV